jgi:hypothetical protein
MEDQISRKGEFGPEGRRDHGARSNADAKVQMAR